MSPVTRVTLFKIPSEKDQQQLVDLYKQMPQKAVKDGKPYISSVEAGKASSDQRAQGFTVVAISRFNSKEDFNYYDTECEAHLELRGFAKNVNQGFAMIYFENEVE
ncbi:stress responsive a b barrel domain-containing [Fusarium longipes]|uniref:Stress responsive a b barrel domain-containing n=1 Tax=Fusarium longipes TaxID=694270 RepID=A0A395T1X6_9HYPO|nr:stress responsive a b barrel domain-containing [Fusarium longipes]